MGNFSRQGAGNQFVVRGLVFHLILIFTVFKHQSRAGKGAVQHNVDFVERQPVSHQTVKGLEAGTGVTGKELHHFAVTPGSVLGDQMHRHIEVAQRD